MSRSRILRSLAAAGLIAAAGAYPAADAGAQSLLSAGGLGAPVDAMDARARALGGVGTGLFGFGLSLENPADIGAVPAPTVLVTLQPEWTQTTIAGIDQSTSSVRFPQINAAFPIGERWALGAGYVGVLDQRWSATVADTLVLSGEPVAVEDRFVSDGGVAAFRAGAAYRIPAGLSVGVRVDGYTGSLTRSLTREFDPESGLRPAAEQQGWSYSGIGVGAGASWTFEDRAKVAGSFAVGGTLRAEAIDTLPGVEERDYTVPATASLGGSARIAPATVVSASARWTGWSNQDELFAGTGGARDYLRVGGGVEWEGPARGGANFPVRLGLRYAQLPFGWTPAGEGDLDFPNERAITGGIGARIAEGAIRTDLSMEAGSRGGETAGFEESFWRVNLSLTVLGR